jgi:hypothetical protein
VHDHHHHPLNYGRGYLTGRVEAYRRGSLSLAYVIGAVGVAKRFGVTDADISDILQTAGLQWNADADAVVPLTRGSSN